MADSTGRAVTITGTVHRLVPSRYPTVTLFDSARDADELELLAELEGLTNPRLRNELGNIAMVAREDAMFGPGCTPIMAAFCHPAPSRFTDGSFGVYYAAREIDTAIAETRHHRERFLREAGIPRETLEMRCYTTTLAQPMAALPDDTAIALLDPDSYSASQSYGARSRAAGFWGIVYPSVRDPLHGECVAIFRPRALHPVVQGPHFRYYWNGERIDAVIKELGYAPDPVARGRAVSAAVARCAQADAHLAHALPVAVLLGVLRADAIGAEGHDDAVVRVERVELLTGRRAFEGEHAVVHPAHVDAAQLGQLRVFGHHAHQAADGFQLAFAQDRAPRRLQPQDRKSTRLNSSH